MYVKHNIRSLSWKTFFHQEERLYGKTNHAIGAVPEMQVAILHSCLCRTLRCLDILTAARPHDEQPMGHPGKCQGAGELERGGWQICREISAPWLHQKKLMIKQHVSFLPIPLSHNGETIKTIELLKI